MQYPNNIKDFTQCNHGLLNFIAGVCRKLKVDSIINKHTESNVGRKPDISYGTLGTMMISMFANGHQPLYLLEEFFEQETLDLDGIFKESLSNCKITDDKLALLLDKLAEANPKKIFSEISSNAINEYNLTVNSINFDTTSMVMWGEYNTPEGKIGKVSIDFGHSKQKRDDKKQIKMALGVANGCIVDADVMSGNYDDKTFNSDKIDNIETILSNTNTDKENFYYIADNASFSYDNFKKMSQKKLNMITRLPETTKLCKEIIETVSNDMNQLENINLTNSKGDKVEYSIKNEYLDYKGLTLNCSICYSHSLRDIKSKNIRKKLEKSLQEIHNLSKKYNSRKFACLEDAKKEILILRKNKIIKNQNLLDININVIKSEKRLPGRPSKNSQNTITIYSLEIETIENEDKIRKAIDKACIFVLVSNDMSISELDMLKEYKTQISVENRFKQLKSSHFINAIFLKDPKRIEALAYLLLTTIMILSVIECVVRREMANANDLILGPGKIKMSKPTLLSIKRIMSYISYKVVEFNDNSRHRALARELTHSERLILKYIGLDEEIFIA
ncbi:MAG: IS1634 family transposase [Paraclostridium sp.]